MISCTAATGAASCSRRYQHIPLSEKMGCAFSSIPGKIYHHHARSGEPESAPYVICRQPVFARYLNRLGLIWLMLRERHLGGTIILADAHIRYSKPISGRPNAVADLGSLSGDLDRARGRKARVQLQVELFGNDKLGAVLREPISYCPRSRSVRMKRAGTRKSNPPPALLLAGVCVRRDIAHRLLCREAYPA